VSDELFRQDKKKSGERAVYQDEEAVKPADKYKGPIIGVDSFRDRFERLEAGQRELGESVSNRTPLHLLPNYSSAGRLKAEICEIAGLGVTTWNLPLWRPAELSREILNRLSDSVHQLKVVMRASDLLINEVEALYEVEKTADASDVEETAEETKDE
jgi:hypothetical protein